MVRRSESAHFLANVIVVFLANVIVVFNVCSEPVIRGILSAVLCIGIEIGIFAVFFIGSVMEWRQTALVCMIVPITTTITALIVRKICSLHSDTENSYSL